MKKITFLILCVFLCFMSCAEQGPIEVGKLECKIEVSLVTPSIAVVNFDIPNTDSNLISYSYDWDKIILVDYQLSELSSYHGGAIFGSRNANGSFSFTELTPNTTYYVILQTAIDLNKGDVESDSLYSYYYYTGESFTTPKEGDYGEFKFEYVDDLKYNNSWYTLIKLCVPVDYSFDLRESENHSSKLEASLNPEMEDVIWGTGYLSYPLNLFDNLKDKYQLADNEFIYGFPLLEKKKYYLKYNGNIYLRNINDNLSLNIKNFDLEGTIDLSNN